MAYDLSLVGSTVTVASYNVKLALPKHVLGKDQRQENTKYYFRNTLASSAIRCLHEATLTGRSVGGILLIATPDTCKHAFKIKKLLYVIPFFSTDLVVQK